MDNTKQLLSMIGIAKKSGRIIVGVPMIIEHIQKKKALDPEEFLLIEACDTSENTHKRLTDKCEFYGIKRVQVSVTCEALGAAIGKSAVAAVAIIGKDMCRGVESRI